MYQVLLVDDEPWVIQSLQKLVPWDELNVQITTTTDSVDALAILLELKPDIVITDVKMPNISGLDLMRFVTENNLTSEFIVLSGYSNFEYARQAIEYGVFSYLLKPMQKEEIIATVTLLINNIQQKKYQKSEQTEHFLLDHPVKKEVYYPQIVTEKMTVLAARITFEEQLLLEQHVNTVLIDSFRMGSNQYACLLAQDSAQTMQLAEDFLLKNIGAKQDFLSFGISETDETGSEKSISSEKIEKLIQQALIASQDYYLRLDRCIAVFHPLKQSWCDNFLAKIKNLMQQDNDQQLTQSIMVQLPRFVADYSLSTQDLVYIHNHIVLLCKSNGNKENCPVEPIKIEEFSLVYRSLDDMLRALTDLLMEYLPIVTEPSENKAFKQLILYLDNNFEKDITLSDMSKEFYISLTYICDLFRRNLDTTFVKYITSLRLNKAKDLICFTRKPLGEIVLEVGYRDYSYFMRQFKLFHGVTPGQMRKKKEGACDE